LLSRIIGPPLPTSGVVKNLFWKIAAKMNPGAWPRCEVLTVSSGGASFGCVTKLATPSSAADAATGRAAVVRQQRAAARTAR
jgi:hypothetical protein